jgi:crotonobetainyl-CoA:carnitine CoA-transferase CaiB-like acyl-CoA transferase
LGADVVKVENPAGGDGMRSWPPLSSKNGGEPFSENFASVNDVLWRQVTEAIGKPELSADARFKTQSDRARNQSALTQILEPEFSKRTATDWLSEMDRRGVPCSDQLLSRRIL